MEDLEEECKKDTNVVVATGHSIYWLKFVEKYSDKDGPCDYASENTLNNGSILSIVVNFNSNCERYHGVKPLTNCKLLYGSYKDDNNEAGCHESSYTNKDDVEVNIDKNDKQILLIVQRHGKSHANVAMRLEKKDRGLQERDSSLWPTGVLDAIAINNRLNRN